MATGHKLEELAKEDHKWLSDDYKREVVEKMSVSQLVDTVSFKGVGWSAARSTNRELAYCLYEYRAQQQLQARGGGEEAGVTACGHSELFCSLQCIQKSAVAKCDQFADSAAR